MFLRSCRTNLLSVLGVRNLSAQAGKVVGPPSSIVEVKKSNIKQSPLKMKFLAMLIRGCWLPDALAQLKFSPKHKAVDLAKMVKVIIVNLVLQSLSSNVIPPPFDIFIL